MTAFLCQNKYRIDHLGGDVIAKLENATLEECHAWADDQLDAHGWGGVAIVNDGKVISSRSRTCTIVNPFAFSVVA